MNDNEHDLAQIPDARPIPRRLHVPPLVWVIPLVAALIGGWIVVQTWLAKGPEITIAFRTADGIEPGKTRIRYKDVDIGQVVRVKFSADGGVIVRANISKDATNFLRVDSRFWVVKPRVSAAGVTGIGTLLSGAYISLAAGKKTEEGRDFTGLEIPPVETEDLPGREFVLHARDVGSLDIGAPVLFRRVRAGEVSAFQVDPDGRGVTLRVFVDAPFDRFVTQDSRFWQASGVELSLDAAGVKVQTQSLVSMIDGGVSFEAPDDAPPSARAAADTKFDLYHDRDDALKHPYTEVHPYVAYFKESLRGLSPGAPVDLHGIVIGEVRRFGIEFDRTRGIFRFPVEVDIYPERLRERYASGADKPDDSTRMGQRELVDRLVAGGMRAQLKSGNLVTGQLYIAMDFFPKAAPAHINWDTERPEMPTVPGGFAALTDTLSDVATKLDSVPFDQIGAQLVKTMKDLDTTLHSTTALVNQLNTDVAPEAKAALTDARQAMDAAQAILSEQSPLQSELRDTLRQLSRSARALAELSDYLERHPESLIRGKKEGER